MENDQYYMHPSAIVEPGVSIGDGTRVWAFTHILPGVIIGSDCNICDHVFVETGVSIGNRVTIKCGIYLWEGVVIQDDVFLGPNVVFTNDKRPRSKQYPTEFLQTVIKQGASIGANSTILPGISIGRYAMVGAGTVVTRNVPDYGLVFGNPGRLVGWVCRCGERIDASSDHSSLQCSCGLYYSISSDGVIEE
ncbi:transferase [Anaerosporomusa subterranea]|uniref:Transferase n=1 Tax=Anaerosporomusa subterranea TaxID=1794912 RepID=A0A154BR65_ANASB|nr:acyltransferase [Anaerosporomusa subterranea]KYZ76426.1 transferase [Anaerosporomusa subterranea]